MASSSPVLQLPARVEALSGLSAIPLEYVRPADERASLGDALDLARTHANDHTAPRIPVVDISPFLTDTASSQQQRDACVEAVRAAAADWGVMHIAGHGIPVELMDRLRAAGAAFFALPIQDKEAYANDPAAGRLQGYGSRLANNACGQREWEDYLFHLLQPDALADHALWPVHPPDYVPATREFGRRTRDLASTLLAILSMGLLGKDRGDALEKALVTTDDQQQRQEEDLDLLLQFKINYYPRCPQPELAVGVETHTDVSALSFILHNGVPGLQVLHGGRWVTARDEPGTIIVHVGDALEILSNGRYTSVLHRGLVNREAVRISWVVFCEPPPEAVLLRPLPELVTPDHPARFTPRTFKQHLDSKIFRKKQQQLEGDHHHDDPDPEPQTQTN